VKRNELINYQGKKKNRKENRKEILKCIIYPKENHYFTTTISKVWSFNIN